MRISRAARLMAPLMAVVLSGCLGGLLGGGKPAQQYRFGGGIAATSQASPVGQTGPALTLRPAHFAAEIDGDRILTVTGDQAAYLKNARWVAPAPSLFDAAVRAAFHADAGGVMLAPRADGIGAGPLLSIDVTRFEASYTSAGSAPTIRIVANATVENGGRGIVAERPFVEDVPASANSVSAVVSAFDQATSGMVMDVAAWASRATFDATPAARR